MKQLDNKIIKNRSREMTSLFHKISKKQNEKWINWEGFVIIDGRGKNNTYLGRNFAYKQVVLKGNLNLGDFVKVKIIDGTIFDLRGQVIE